MKRSRLTPLLLATADPDSDFAGQLIQLHVKFNSFDSRDYAGKRLSQVSMYVALFTLALIGDRQFW